MSLSAKPDMKVTATDALDYDGQDEPAKRRRLGPLLVAGATLTVVILIAWLVYGEQILSLIGGPGGSGQVPVVQADPGPIKVRPDKPGGMNVPNRDKLVYQRLDGGDNAPTHVERLLPPPEKPLPRSAIASQDASQSQNGGAATATGGGNDAMLKDVPDAQTVAKATPPAPAPPPPTSPPQTATATAPTTAGGPTRLMPRGSSDGATGTATAPAPPAAPVGQVERQPSPAPSAETAPATTTNPPAPTPKAPTSAPSTQTASAQPAPAPSKTEQAPSFTNAYRVQLLAARSQSGAEAEWRRIRSENKDLLGNLALNLTRVDLGKDKGIYYRVRVGPLADEAAAKTLCARLKQRKQGCLVVRPGS